MTMLNGDEAGKKKPIFHPINRLAVFKRFLPQSVTLLDETWTIYHYKLTRRMFRIAFRIVWKRELSGLI